jgi:uncharacterized membrane protein YadS
VTATGSRTRWRVIAGRGAIDADDEDSGDAIAAILALGAVALFSFPAIGHALQLTDTQFGLWAGLAVDNTAETTATGAAFSPQAQNVAVAVKNTRNALIGVVVLIYALYWSSRGGVAVEKGWQRRAAFIWRTFPKFVLGFIVVSAIATLGLLTKTQITSLGNSRSGRSCSASRGSGSTSTSASSPAPACAPSSWPPSASSSSQPAPSASCC